MSELQKKLLTREEAKEQISRCFPGNVFVFEDRNNAVTNFEVYAKPFPKRHVYIDVPRSEGDTYYVSSTDIYNFMGYEYVYGSGTGSMTSLADIASLLSWFFEVPMLDSSQQDFSFFADYQVSLPPKEPYAHFYPLLKEEVSFDAAKRENGSDDYEWKLLQAKIRPGDRIRRVNGCFCPKTGRHHCLSLRYGIALLRDEKIIELCIPIIS